MHTLCISSPNHLLFATHAHTIAAYFAVIPMLCHLFLSLCQLPTWKSFFKLNVTHPSDHSHLCLLKCHLIFFPYMTGPIVEYGEYPTCDQYFKHYSIGGSNDAVFAVSPQQLVSEIFAVGLCADVDECAVSVNSTQLCNANEYCVNVIGSFKCSSEC